MGLFVARFSQGKGNRLCGGKRMKMYHIFANVRCFFEKKTPLNHRKMPSWKTSPIP